MMLGFWHETRDGGKRNEKQSQDRAGPKWTVAERVNHNGRHGDQDKERRRRQREYLYGFRRQAAAFLKPEIVDHGTPLANDRPDEENEERHQHAESDKPMFHQELQMVIVDIDTTINLKIPERDAKLPHLARTEMSVSPSADAEERMIRPDRSRHLDMVLPFPRHAVKHRRRTERTYLMFHLLRHENGRKKIMSPNMTKLHTPTNTRRERRNRESATTSVCAK